MLVQDNSLRWPDWRKQDEYPIPEKLNLDEWRWEFLRRRPAYIADYEKPKEAFHEASKDYYFEKKYGLGNPVDPRLGCIDIERMEQRRQKSGRPNELFPYTFESMVQFVDWRLSWRYACPGEVDQRLKHVLKAHDVLLRIDLMRPLQVQLEELRPILEDGQRNWNNGRLIRTKAHKRLWLTYLRVLDARRVGASYKELSTILPRHIDGGKTSVRAVVQAAERLRDRWPF